MKVLSMKYFVFILIILDFCIFASAERVEEILVKEACKFAQQAKNTASEYQQSQDKEIFQEACNKYQQALSKYQKLYDLIKKNGENDTGNRRGYCCTERRIFLI